MSQPNRSDMLIPCSKGKQLGETIPELEPFDKKYLARIDGGTFRLASYGVAGGLSESEEKRLTAAIVVLRQGWDILNKVDAFEERRKGVELTAVGLRQQIDRPVHLIEANRYETVCAIVGLKKSDSLSSGSVEFQSRIGLFG